MSPLMACTRPLRATSRSCSLPAILLTGIVFIGLVLWVLILSPLITLHQTWHGATCTLAAPMTLQRVARSKSSAGWLVVAPVTVGREATPATAHRWPSRTMTDVSQAALFNWWLGIGGTGTVLELTSSSLACSSTSHSLLSVPRH